MLQFGCQFVPHGAARAFQRLVFNGPEGCDSESATRHWAHSHKMEHLVYLL